jgi:hypothetical protein
VAGFHLKRIHEKKARLAIMPFIRGKAGLSLAALMAADVVVAAVAAKMVVMIVVMLIVAEKGALRTRERQQRTEVMVVGFL